MNAVMYKKGSDFSIPLDTIHNAKAEWDSTRIIAHLDRIKSDCDQYDWQLIFYNSGEVFKLKNITHYSRTEKQDPQDTYTCSNDMSVIANDSLIHISGDDGQFSTEAVIPIKQ